MESWALATLYEPAGEAVMVGGDLYDWFRLPDGKVVFFSGDVSGKGPVAGALAMSIRRCSRGTGASDRRRRRAGVEGDPGHQAAGTRPVVAPIPTDDARTGPWSP